MHALRVEAIPSRALTALPIALQILLALILQFLELDDGGPGIGLQVITKVASGLAAAD